MSAAEKPRCTIIVLNYNGEALLPACLDSLLKQVDANIEITVVDNNSSDGSKALVEREYPSVRFLALDGNYGFSKANNVALRDAIERGSEYALLLNNDTYAATDFISQMISVIESDPQIGVVCPKIYFALEPERLWYAGGDFSPWTGSSTHRGWKEIDRGQYDSRLEFSQGTGCAMMVRCAALKEIGLLDEQFFIYAEDLDWSLRFMEHGYRLVFAPKSHLWHIDGATNVKSVGSGSAFFRQFLSTRNMVFVARKHVRWFQLPTYFCGFLINHVAFFTAVRLRDRDFKALYAIYRGVFHGLSTTLESSTAT